MISRIAAHRGGALEAPENTLQAFGRAMELGVEEIECDIHLSADRHLMVHHDATLERTTDGQGPLSAQTADILRSLRLAGSATARIPFLSEVLDLLAPTEMVLRLELKCDAGGQLQDGMAAAASQEIDKTGMTARCYITSFAADYLRAPAIVESGMDTLWLVEAATFEAIGGIDGLERVLDMVGTRNAALPIGALDAIRLGEAFGRGLTPSAFGCHTEDQIARALALGLPVFTTDRPSLARAIRDNTCQA